MDFLIALAFIGFCCFVVFQNEKWNELLKSFFSYFKKNNKDD